MSYSFNDVMRLTGATKSHLTHWTREQIVHADVVAADGPGKHRRFSWFNLFETSVALQLNLIAAPVMVIRAVNQQLRWVEQLGVKDTHEAKRAREVLKRVLLDMADEALGRRSKSSRSRA